MSYKTITLRRVFNLTSNETDSKLLGIYKILHEHFESPNSYTLNTLPPDSRNEILKNFKTSTEKVSIDSILFTIPTNVKFGNTELIWANNFHHDTKQNTYSIQQTSGTYTLIDKFGDKILVTEAVNKNAEEVYKETFIIQLSEQLFINFYRDEI